MYKFNLAYPQNQYSAANPSSVLSNRSQTHSDPRTNSTYDDSGIEKEDQSPPIETCIVCGAETRGMHFQVAACRACAAFFRRSVKTQKVYKCRRDSRDCDLTKPPNGKPICRYCRLQKCYNVGMRKEQPVEELVVAPKPVVKPTTTTRSMTYGIDTAIQKYPSQLTVTNGNTYTRNVDKLVEEIKDYFRTGRREPSFYTPPGIYSTPFQQIQYAFAKFREDMCPAEPIPAVDHFNKLSGYVYQEEYARRIAQMMIACDAFVEFPPDDKWKLFKHAWPMLAIIERQFSSCELFGFEMDDPRQLMTKEVAIDYTKSSPYVPGMEPRRVQELLEFCMPMKKQYLEQLRIPIKQLRLTQFETCYLVGLIMFSVNDVRGLSPETIERGQELVEQFSTELHNYYTYEMKLINYASRHAKLVKLISGAQTIVAANKDHMVMAKIFDIFVTDIYESELYE